MVEGYATLQQAINDYKLFLLAQSEATDRFEGESVTDYLRKRIVNRLENASPSLKRFIKKNQFKDYDIRLLAVHAMTRRCRTLNDFLEMMPDARTAAQKIAKILSSSVFKQGKLSALSALLPKKLDSKADLIEFIKSRSGVSNAELHAIGSYFTGKHWHRWLMEAEVKHEIQRARGEWYA